MALESYILEPITDMTASGRKDINMVRELTIIKMEINMKAGLLKI